MPRKKHTKCSTEGCIGIRSNGKWFPSKCVACRRLHARSYRRKIRHRSVIFAPGIDKFRSKAPPR